MIDHLFDILNFRNPLGRGFKQPGPSAFRQRNLGRNFEIYCEMVTGIKTHADIQQLLSTHSRKIGKLIGFVASIKSTIEMANKMFTSIDQPINHKSINQLITISVQILPGSYRVVVLVYSS